MNNIISFIKKVINKENFIKSKICLLIIFSIGCSLYLVITKQNIIWDRIPFFATVIFFIGLHLILKVNSIYEWIYKNRYKLSIFILIYCVLMGYSGSSIGTYAEVIQGEYQEDYYTPILGKYRSIRSDEWSINTPIYTSQANDTEEPFSYFNDNLRGTVTDMSLIANAPVLDISLIAKPFNIGYILLGAERGLSFLWYGKLITLLLVAFEFCMLITNKKKLASLCGMIVIVFSAATQWWYSTEVLIWGMLVILLVDKFMLTDKLKVKIGCAIGIFISGASYIFIFYPAWQLTYGYIYLALMIWVILKNIKKYKINLRDILIIVCVLLLIGTLVARFYTKSHDALNLIMNTDYPGERFELGGDGNGTKVVFSYVYSLLFPYVNINNPCEYAGMLSFFPIPMLVAVIYILRNVKNSKENCKFLIPMLCIAIMLTIWTFFKNSEIFAKFSLLYMVPTNRSAVPLGFTQVLLIIYMLGNIKKEDIIIKNEKIAKIISVLLSLIIMYIAIKTDNNQVMKGIRIYLCGIITLYTIYQIININKQENKNYAIYVLIAIAIITGVAVNPVQRGIKVLTKKPIAVKVQEIVAKDSTNNLWIIDNTNFYIPNYIMANGARVINSTNIYPNFELYETVLEEESKKVEVRSIYNRYAHLNIEISDENKLQLLYSDSIKLYITTEKLKEIGVKYIVSTRENLNEFDQEGIQYNQLYGEYGIYIYKLNY